MILFLLACSSVDADLLAQGHAVAAYRAGQEVLNDDPLRAREHFIEANEARSDGLLEAWIADATARSGDLADAIHRLELVLEAHPDFAEARYNRASYLARAGRLDEAGPELEAALSFGVRRPRQAMVDPDFAMHTEHAAFDFLPDNLLIATLDVPRDTLFWGNEAAVRLRVLGADAAPVQIEGSLTGPLELVRVKEGVIDTTEGAAREIEWTYRVGAAGSAEIGPWVVRSAGHEVRLGARRFETTAPPGKTWDTPPEAPLVAGPELPASDGIQFANGTLWVRSQLGDHVDIKPRPRKAPVRLQLLDRAQVVAVLERYREAKAPHVTIRRAGKVVFDSER